MEGPVVFCPVLTRPPPFASIPAATDLSTRPESIAARGIGEGVEDGKLPVIQTQFQDTPPGGSTLSGLRFLVKLDRRPQVTASLHWGSR